MGENDTANGVEQKKDNIQVIQKKEMTKIIIVIVQ